MTRDLINRGANSSLMDPEYKRYLASSFPRGMQLLVKALPSLKDILNFPDARMPGNPSKFANLVCHLVETKQLKAGFSIRFDQEGRDLPGNIPGLKFMVFTPYGEICGATRIGYRYTFFYKNAPLSVVVSSEGLA